jgi:hypothetical protein
LELAEKAAQLTNHHDPRVLQTLALARKAAGRSAILPSQSLKTAQKAPQLTRQAEQDRLRRALGARFPIEDVNRALTVEKAEATVDRCKAKGWSGKPRACRNHRSISDVRKIPLNT